ncbi:MAG: hypothetical protein GX767_05195 [Firmicutes bacterium]|nr:hypothetical protein [Bacillota bacterium]
MRIGNFLFASIKEILKTNNITINSSGSLPERFSAKVKEIIQGQALLVRGEQVFAAKLDVPVKKGEYLLLQFMEQKDGHLYYRVLARSSKPLPLSSNPFIMYHPGYFTAQGRLLPFYIKPLNDKDKKDKRIKNFNNETKIFEIAVMTENIGIVLILISLDAKNASHFFSFRLYVEQRDYINFFTERINSLLSSFKMKNIILNDYQIELMDTSDLDETRENFSRFISVDQKA